MLKCLLAMWETWVRSLGREDPVEKEWQPTPVLLPGKFHELRRLISYSPWGSKESDMTERLHFHFSLSGFSSVLFSWSVVSDSLRSHGLQHPRLPCTSPTPRAYSNSSPLSRWCHPTISSSVVRGYWYFSLQSWFQHVLHPAQHFASWTLHKSYISRVTIYNLDTLLSWLGTSLLLHVQF